MRRLPGGQEVELLLVAPGKERPVTGGISRLAAPGTGRGLETLATALLADTGVLAQQGRPGLGCRHRAQAGGED